MAPYMARLSPGSLQVTQTSVHVTNDIKHLATYGTIYGNLGAGTLVRACVRAFINIFKPIYVIPTYPGPLPVALFIGPLLSLLMYVYILLEILLGGARACTRGWVLLRLPGGACGAPEGASFPPPLPRGSLRWFRGLYGALRGSCGERLLHCLVGPAVFPPEGGVLVVVPEHLWFYQLALLSIEPCSAEVTWVLWFCS